MTRNATNKRTNGQGTVAWLKATTPTGAPRIQTLSWGRLARVYNAKTSTPATRRMIEREARRVGYVPSIVLNLNAWE